MLLVELSGANAGAAANGLYITAGGTTVRGFAINRFGNDGILLGQAGGNTIGGNFVGTTVDGSAAGGNLGGVRVGDISSGSSDNTIGGTTPAARNVISGNRAGFDVVIYAASSGNVVAGNFIGTDASGSALLPGGGRLRGEDRRFLR